MVLPVDAFHQEFPGESEYVEFKQGLSEQRLQLAAVAFSNADGGVFVIGVSPNHAIVGVHAVGEKVKEIHQALRDTRSPGRYEVHQLQVGSSTLLVVSVARRVEGFAQAPNGAVLLRQGASNVPLLGEQLTRFIQKRSFQRFESTPTDASLSSADDAFVAALAGSFGWPLDDALPSRLAEEGFAVVDAGEMMLTVAGSLLLLEDPSSVGGRPYIDIRRFAEGDPDPDKTWLLKGPAPEQIRAATRAVLDELGSISAIVGVERVEMPKLPERAVREAVANAVAHRSYEHTGSAVRIEIHPSQVTIGSPGSLPEPVTLDNIRHQQSARNDRLLRALRRFGLAEDQGKGIDRIEDDMASELLQAPEFADDGSFFSVTLRLGSAVTPRERAWIRGLVVAGKLDGRSAPVVVAAARDGKVTNSQVRTLLGLDSTQARRILQALVEAGVFVQFGERGGAEYRLAPGLGSTARMRHTAEELRELVLSLADRGPITNALVRDQIGLDRHDALAVLQDLVTDGKLHMTGSRRGSKYVRPGAQS
ncbi:MAG TPA: ATP-binding protein [Ilumatobacter sp.]|nr:ATP-binding protein [Ilumatobacter sp.]